MKEQLKLTLSNGVEMPMAGIGTFLLTPDEAEASCLSALENGYRLIYRKRLCQRAGCGAGHEEVRPGPEGNFPGNQALACFLRAEIGRAHV